MQESSKNSEILKEELLFGFYLTFLPQIFSIQYFQQDITKKVTPFTEVTSISQKFAVKFWLTPTCNSTWYHQNQWSGCFVRHPRMPLSGSLHCGSHVAPSLWCDPGFRLPGRKRDRLSRHWQSSAGEATCTPDLQGDHDLWTLQLGWGKNPYWSPDGKVRK